MNKQACIYVAGHRGMLGTALIRALMSQGYRNLVFADRERLDLRNQAAVRDFYARTKPDYVFVAAAKVGGILANDQYPASFIYDNLMIEANLIHGAYEAGVTKLLFLGSTCIYPREAPQPLKEEYLLTGPLEPTNQWYAVAKIAGIKLCQAYQRQYGSRFIAAMPTNLYGPGDSFDLETSHVVPALMRKIHEAKLAGSPAVKVWGTGTPRREFCHVDDCAAACLHLMAHYEEPEIINIGVGADVTIADLAGIIKRVVGYEGELMFDHGKPDGAPRKLVDARRILGLGWKPTISFEEGLASTYDWYLMHGAGKSSAGETHRVANDAVNGRGSTDTLIGKIS